MRLLIVGHGRMGKLVESLAAAQGFEVAAIVDSKSGDRGIDQGDFGDVDVAIDFTHADAVRRNLPRLAARHINVVVGTTGWGAHEPAMREVAARTGIGVLAAANFSLGMNLFQIAVEDAAKLFAPHEAYGAWMHELHHAAKKDAPSGTALQLKAGMERVGYHRPIDLVSTRAGFLPGTHTVGFDGPSDSVTLTHEVRDRSVFARGALEAAKWLKGRRGWFTMRDMLMGE
jgi:4-hydroxy-tetrahydrodipicolinate reductase